MSKLTITLPELPLGADQWLGSVPVKQWKTPPDTRQWHERIAYRVLMYFHDKAERFWHWCYYKAQKVAPPMPFVFDEKPYPLAVRYEGITTTASDTRQTQD